MYISFVYQSINNSIQFHSYKHGKKYQDHHEHKHAPARPSSSRRDIVVHKTNGPIWGKYPLYDLLSLSTTTGSIAVIIDPQAADPDDPFKPARVSLKSESGSISVGFKVPHINSESEDGSPEFGNSEISSADWAESEADAKDGFRSHLSPRPYEVEIHTALGSISGSIAFSSVANISSESGSISTRVIPLVFPDSPDAIGRNVTFSTLTKTGSTFVSVADPFFVKSSSDDDNGDDHDHDHDHDYDYDHDDDGDDNKSQYPKARDIVATSSHVVGGSGSIVATYPGSWAGHVHASTAEGKMPYVRGPGLEVQEHEKEVDGVRDAEPQHEGKEWWGGSGRMNVSLSAEGTGSVNFFVGHRRG